MLELGRALVQNVSPVSVFVVKSWTPSLLPKPDFEKRDALSLSGDD